MAAQLTETLRSLKLPGVQASYEQLAEQARSESYSYERYLSEVLECEQQQRRHNRVERALRASKIPLEKNLENFDRKRLPAKADSQLSALLEGVFVDHAENVLAFGNPGSGKTHLLCALGQELIQQGKRVLFRPCDLLVQDLLAAKKELNLAAILKKLSRFEALIIDDIGYVQQSRQEMALGVAVSGLVFKNV